MSKPNKNRKRLYDAYKSQGRRELNKQSKQDRNKKRIARFEKRRSEGKAYVYKKGQFSGECKSNNNSNKYTEYAKLESIFRKLENALAKEKMLLKEKSKYKKGKEE